MLKEADRAGVTHLVAVGGDGTVNEVAALAMEWSLPMAVIPLGSGNALARHLGIPLAARRAVKLLGKGRERVIDAGFLENGIARKIFVSAAGTGFDAHVAEKFLSSKGRGLWNYIRLTVLEFFKYRPNKYRIEMNGTVWEGKAFLVAFANVAQYGNHAMIAPGADPCDGLLEVCIVKNVRWWNAGLLSLLLFAGGLRFAPQVRYYRVSAVKIHVSEDTSGVLLHADGEVVYGNSTVSVGVIPGVLRVLA